MSLKTLSLAGLEFIENPADLQYVFVRTGPGDEDFANVLLSDFRTFITAQVNERIDNIDTGGGGTGPSIWPVPRTMTLAGVVTGSVAFDGSANFTLNSSMADGALSIAKTSGLQAALDGLQTSINSLASKNNPNFTGTVTLAGDMLPDVDNVRSLGSPTLMWKDVYIGPGSLYINGQKVLEDNSGTIRMLADPNQNIAIQTSGSGDIELAPTGTGVIQMKGPLTLLAGSKIRSSNGTALIFDDSISFEPGNGFVGPVTIDGNTILTTASFNPANYAQLGAAANFSSLTVAGNTVYHTGNFDPASSGYLAQPSTLYGTGYNADADTFAAGTKRLVHNTNFNLPGTSSTYWYIETLQSGTDGTTLLQRAYGTTNDETYTRRCNAGVWGPWRRVWNSASFDPTSKLDSNAAAASAVKLQTERTFALTGAVTANGVLFDGTGNVVLTTSIADGSVTMASISGLSAAISGKVDKQSAYSDFAAATPANAVDGSDANNYLAGSRYYASASGQGIQNLPGNGTYFIETFNGGTGLLLQHAIDTNGATSIRRRVSGTWSAWRTAHDNVSLDPSTLNAATATKLQTARSIALTGPVTGSVNFDGSANATITTTIANDALTIAMVSGLQAALDAGGSGGGGGGVSWIAVEAANVNPAVTKTGYLMRCAGGLYQVTLPASVPVGFEVTVKAIGGQVRIVTNGNTINDMTPGNDLLLEDGDAATLVASAVGELGLIWANNALSGDSAGSGGGGGTGGGGGFVLVGEAVATTSTTTLSIPGLDVANDGPYFVVYGLKNALAGYTGVECFFNGDTDTTKYYTNYVASQSSSARQNNAEAVGLDTSGGTSTGTCWLQLDVDGYARLTNTISRGQPGLVNSMFIALARATLGNVTSMEWKAKNANGIAAGSYIRVYKMATISAGDTGGGTGTGTAGMTLVGSQTITGTPGASLTVEGLNLAVHDNYLIRIISGNAAGTANIMRLHYNGDFLQNSYARRYITNRGAAGGDQTPDLASVATNGRWNADIWVRRDLDGRPMALVHSGLHNNASINGTLDTQHFIHIRLNTENVTSVTLNTSVGAGSLAVGSKIEVWRVGPGASNADVLTEGTSFPLNPGNNQVFKRTDRQIEYYWNTTLGKWLSTQVFTASYAEVNVSNSTPAYLGRFPVDSRYGMYLERVSLSALVDTTNNASNYWTFSFNRLTGALGSTTIASINSSTWAASNWVSAEIVLNTVLDPTAAVMALMGTRTGSAGGVYANSVLHYRLIG